MSNNLQKLTWKDIRKEVNTLNPELATLIDDFDPSDEYAIYKLECPWGEYLIREGVLYLPNSHGKWVRLDDSSIDPHLADDLYYNSNMPLGMVLDNSLELYMEALGRVMPYQFMSKGTIFGLWISLLKDKSTSNNIWTTSNIVAGSRSTLLLPKISDATAFKKLKKIFGIQCKMPETLTDQWPLLRELAQHREFSQPWSASVIYFSKKWLELNKSIAWKLFKNYFLELAWEISTPLRNQMVLDLVFSRALEEKNLKPNPYLTDTVKHLFIVGQNHYPAYKVATNNSAVPLNAFQLIFSNIYGLKYQPTIMVPDYLYSGSSKSLYYSLEVPTLLAFYPKSRKTINKLEDLREIKHIFQRVTDYLQQDYLRAETLKLKLKTPLHRFIDEVNLEYYHTDEDPYNETRKTSELHEVDQNIIRESKKHDKLFCETSPFLRGCVRISVKQPQK